MRLFEKLFSFAETDIAKAERRLQARYAIAADFPLIIAAAGSGWNGTGRARDIGPGGLGVTLDRGPSVDTGSAVRVGIRLDGFEILASGQLRHVRKREVRGFNCGISLAFSKDKEREAFYQLLVPVSIGATLAPVEPTKAAARAGADKAVFAGEYASKLTVWSASGGEPSRFELEVEGHIVRGSKDNPDLETVVSAVGKPTKSPTSTRKLDPSSADLKRLLRWTVLNLGSTVPAETRKFLTGCAT